MITSPLLVRGTISKEWYYEDYPVRLKTLDNSVIADFYIVSNDLTDLDDTISFETSLVFENPTATSGVLVVGGDREKEEVLLVPVLFDVE